MSCPSEMDAIINHIFLSLKLIREVCGFNQMLCILFPYQLIFFGCLDHNKLQGVFIILENARGKDCLAISQRVISFFFFKNHQSLLVFFH